VGKTDKAGSKLRQSQKLELWFLHTSIHLVSEAHLAHCK